MQQQSNFIREASSAGSPGYIMDLHSNRCRGYSQQHVSSYAPPLHNPTLACWPTSLQNHRCWLRHILCPHFQTADVGFGVGHTRETETKGIWVWGEPKTVKDGNGERMVRSCIPDLIPCLAKHVTAPKHAVAPDLHQLYVPGAMQ